MKLKRITGDVAWLLDDRYEIRVEYNHGFGLRIADKETLVPNPAYDPNDMWGKRQPQVIPQEHFYFSGGGQSSQARGLLDVPQP